jgi:hypothetical protein
LPSRYFHLKPMCAQAFSLANRGKARTD